MLNYNFEQLFNPVLAALHNLGGSGSVSQIEEEVVKILNLTNEEFQDLHRGSTTKLSYRLAWARNYLKRYGLMKRKTAKFWELTEIGFSTKIVDVDEVKKILNQTRSKIEENQSHSSNRYSRTTIISSMSTERSSLKKNDIPEELNDLNEFNDENESEEFYDREDSEDDGNVVKGKVFIDKKDFTLREYQTMRNDGDLLLQPSYQRKFVTDLKFASRLIESIILDVPIPAVFLAEEEDGKYSVIDGQQRLTSFIAFLDGFLPDQNKTIFRLTGTKELSVEQGKGKTFAQIQDISIQNKIKTTSIQAVIVKNSSHPDLKFAIFERLNTGSVKLNEDELRNTIFRGTYIDLLSELEYDDMFHTLVNKESFRKRMIYRGMILRFFALSEKSYLNYKSSMKQFCNKELRDNRNMVQDKREEYIERFKKCVELTRYVFGSNAFRRYILGDSDNHNGKWVTNRINMAIFDIQMGGFVNYSKNQIVPKADTIREKFLELLSNNDDFMDSVENKTNDTNVLKKRFTIWYGELFKIIDNNSSNKRSFTFSQKKALFDQNPQCGICKQQILMIEDAEVDHIVPFITGGATEDSNAQISHRFCNRNKYAK